MGADRKAATEQYHRLSLGLGEPVRPSSAPLVSAKELANRFIATQQANWRKPAVTLTNYRNRLGRFLKDHPGLKVRDFSVEMFAAWKISLKRRSYSAESMNSYLGAVRAMYSFAEDVAVSDGLLTRLGDGFYDVYAEDEDMTSVVSYPVRSCEWGDSRYRGNCDGRLFKDLVLRYRAKLVGDPMVGSGTTRDVIAGLNRFKRAGITFWGSDLRNGFDLTRQDLPDRFDFVWIHPLCAESNPKVVAMRA
jgi:hypothetical protein